jgi:uncharacterized protein involved in type VI secretion and phage assembly
MQDDQRDLAVERKRLYGAYPAKVTDIVDPDQQGRVRVQLTWSPDNDNGGYEVWARLAVSMAGNERGTWFIPDVDDEVLVMFEGGDPRRPYVIGSLWNGQDAPPERMDDAGDNYIKTIVTRRDIRLTFDDTEGQETLTIETPGGHQITLKDGDQSVEIKDSSNNSVKLEPSGITLTTASKLTINAGTMEVSAGMVTVNAGFSKFSGVVQSDTTITNTVVSSVYTLGAGNIW